jgi:predicted flavoprotein YhiN
MQSHPSSCSRDWCTEVVAHYNRAVSDTPVPSSLQPATVAIIGAGPAGLMAAETVLRGLPESMCHVHVFDAMPSAARKFLLAGRGGLNLTHSETFDRFIGRYGNRADSVAQWLSRFGPEELRDWAHALGIETFVGTSGRVFPAEMKAAPLLRAWLHRLRASGAQFHMRHRWQGWAAAGMLSFATPDGERQSFWPWVAGVGRALGPMARGCRGYQRAEFLWSHSPLPIAAMKPTGARISLNATLVSR